MNIIKILGEYIELLNGEKFERYIKLDDKNKLQTELDEFNAFIQNNENVKEIFTIKLAEFKKNLEKYEEKIKNFEELDSQLQILKDVRIIQLNLNFLFIPIIR